MYATFLSEILQNMQIQNFLINIYSIIEMVYWLTEVMLKLNEKKNCAFVCVAKANNSPMFKS